MIWFRRIALLGGIVIVLELVAWVGIATLGPDAFRQMLAFYDPRPEIAEVIEDIDDNGDRRRCALFRDELLCIGDEGAAAPPENRAAATVIAAASEPSATPEPEPHSAQRCAVFQGEEICIREGR